MLGPKIDDTLTGLGFESLYLLAEFHDKQATICRARAFDLQSYKDSEDRAARHVEFLKTTPKTVMRYLKQGHGIDRAMELAADHTGVALVTIQARWKSFIRDKDRNAIRARNTLVYDMARLGISNVAIADRLSLHPVTVSRILKKEKSRRLYNKNPDLLPLYPSVRYKKTGDNSPGLSIVKS